MKFSKHSKSLSSGIPVCGERPDLWPGVLFIFTLLCLFPLIEAATAAAFPWEPRAFNPVL